MSGASSKSSPAHVCFQIALQRSCCAAAEKFRQSWFNPRRSYMLPYHLQRFAQTFRSKHRPQNIMSFDDALPRLLEGRDVELSTKRTLRCDTYMLEELS